MRRSGAAGGFGGRTAPRMTRNAKARDVLEVILTIVLRCEPMERDAGVGKGERRGFGVSGGPSARRGDLRAFDFRTIAAWRFDGSLDRDGATARRGPRNVGESAARDPTSSDSPEKEQTRSRGGMCAHLTCGVAPVIVPRRARSNERKSFASSDACGSKIAGDLQWRSSLIIMRMLSEVFAEIQHCSPILLLAPSVTSTRLPLTRTDPEMLPEPTEPRSVL